MKALYKAIRWTLLVCVAFVILVGESFLIERIVAGAIPISFFFFVHSLLVAGIGIWVTLERYLVDDLQLSVLFWLLIATTGPFGAFIFLTFSALYMVFIQSAHVFSEWFYSLFPEERKNEGEKTYERVAYGLDDLSQKTSVVPFRDVMYFGTIEQKRYVIAEINRHFSPEFVPTLREALNDKNNAIRVQAASILSQKDQEFAYKLMELESKYEANKEENAEVIWDIAEAYRAYTESNLLDKEREHEMRAKAIEYYQKYLQMHPERETELSDILGGLYLHDGNFDEAYKRLRHCEKEKNMTESVLIWYMECLFEMQKYDELHKIADVYAHHFDDEQHFMSRIVQYLRLWSHGKTNAPNTASAAS